MSIYPLMQIVGPELILTMFLGVLFYFEVYYVLFRLLELGVKQ